MPKVHFGKRGGKYVMKHGKKVYISKFGVPDLDGPILQSNVPQVGDDTRITSGSATEKKENLIMLDKIKASIKEAGSPRSGEKFKDFILRASGGGVILEGVPPFLKEQYKIETRQIFDKYLGGCRPERISAWASAEADHQKTKVQLLHCLKNKYTVIADALGSKRKDVGFQTFQFLSYFFKGVCHGWHEKDLLHSMSSNEREEADWAPGYIIHEARTRLNPSEQDIIRYEPVRGSSSYYRASSIIKAFNDGIPVLRSNGTWGIDDDIRLFRAPTMEFPQGKSFEDYGSMDEINVNIRNINPDDKRHKVLINAGNKLKKNMLLENRTFTPEQLTRLKQTGGGKVRKHFLDIKLDKERKSAGAFTAQQRKKELNKIPEKRGGLYFSYSQIIQMINVLFPELMKWEVDALDRANEIGLDTKYSEGRWEWRGEYPENSPGDGTDETIYEWWKPGKLFPNLADRKKEFKYHSDTVHNILNSVFKRYIIFKRFNPRTDNHNHHSRGPSYVDQHSIMGIRHPSLINSRMPGHVLYNNFKTSLLQILQFVNILTIGQLEYILSYYYVDTSDGTGVLGDLFFGKRRGKR